MSRLLCLALLGALAAPSLAQSTPRFSVSAGSYLPGASENDRHSQTSFTYTPRLKKMGILSVASVYLDTNRHKTTVGTGTEAVTTVKALTGLGLLMNFKIIPGAPKGVYQLAGLGVYESRISRGNDHPTGYGLGTKLGLGVQKGQVFGELDYTFVSRIKGNDPSGLSLRFGMRL